MNTTLVVSRLRLREHRLWSNFESGGGRIMRVKRARGRALRERRGMLPPTDNFLRMALPALVLTSPRLFVVTLVTWVMHCCVRVINFPLQNIQTRGCSSKWCAPLAPPPPKSGGAACLPRPHHPPRLQSL